MEIQKVFSDMYDEERLYSVLMNEDELALFSEIQKEFNSQSQKELRKRLETQIGNGNSVRGRQLLNDRKIADELGTTLKYNKKTGLPGFLSKNGINQSINSKEVMVKTGGEIISGKTGKIINKYVPGMNNTEFMKSIIKSHTPTSKKILIKAKSLLR